MKRIRTVEEKVETKTTGFKIEWPVPLNIAPLCEVQITPKYKVVVYQDDVIRYADNGTPYTETRYVSRITPELKHMSSTSTHYTLLDARFDIERTAEHLNKVVSKRTRVETDEEED